jgi:hypothetical protein
MFSRCNVLLAIAAVSVSQSLYSQNSNNPKGVKSEQIGEKTIAKPDVAAPSQLVLTKTIMPNAGAELVSSPQCDADGNFYIADADRLSISKLNPKGELVATFRATSSPDMPQLDGAGMFTVSGDGDVRQLVFPHSFDRDVFLYNKDGSFKSFVKLDAGGIWNPSLFVAFPSGNFLGTGQKWDRVAQEYFPFTAIFSSDGTLLKEVHLEDDDYIHKQATSGDSRFVPGGLPGGLNFAISRGSLKVASDGNVYLLRQLNPAVVYAISPGGEIVRRFTVDPGDSLLTVARMAIAGSRAALVFRKGGEGKNIERQFVQIVDLEGNKIVTYEESMVDGHIAFGATLACYTQNPEQFTFLGRTKDEKIVLNVTEPR